MKTQFNFHILLACILTGCFSQQVVNAQNTFPSTGRAGVYTTAPATSLQVIGGASIGTSANYVSIDSATGNLTFKGTAAYKTAGNKYVFKYSANPNYGLFFNSSPLQYEFRNSSALPVFYVNADNGDGVFTGGIKAGNSTSNSAGNIRWTGTDFEGYNGTVWTSLTTGTPYASGTGINISGRIISTLNTSALWNANQLQGKAISATAPANGQVLKYNSSTIRWEPAAESTGITLPYSNSVSSSSNAFSITNSSTGAGIYGENSSGNSSAYGVYGKINNTSAGGFSAAVRGENTSTTANGIGVYGSQAGGGWGVYGTTSTGIGVRGLAGGGTGGYFTSVTGTAGFFASSGGYSLTTGTGNVGIGTASPLLGGIVADTKAGAVNAMFGDNTTGVAIESNFPGIAFNTYFNSGRKYISSGFGSLIGLNPSSGLFTIWSTNVSGTAGANAGIFSRLAIDKNGNVGIGNATPGFPLNFTQSVGDKISLYGNTGPHYGFGIQGFLMQIHTDASSSDIAFGYGTSAAFTENMRVKGNGNVGIGTNAPSYKLDVCGTIRAKEVRVETGWCDYVFDKNYKLKSIDELEKFIDTNKHLPGVAAAGEVEKEGLKVGEMNKAMMEKIEELTLYVIQLSKDNKKLQEEIDLLKK